MKLCTQTLNVVGFSDNGDGTISVLTKNLTSAAESLIIDSMSRKRPLGVFDAEAVTRLVKAYEEAVVVLEELLENSESRADLLSRARLTVSEIRGDA